MSYYYRRVAPAASYYNVQGRESLHVSFTFCTMSVDQNMKVMPEISKFLAVHVYESCDLLAWVTHSPHDRLEKQYFFAVDWLFVSAIYK